MYLSLPQRCYLLCYTVDKEKFELGNIQGRGQFLRAAALTRLTLDGLLSAKGGKVVQLPAEPPGDPFLAEVRRGVPADKPKKWMRFVHDQAHTAEGAVREQLAAAGTITVKEGGWLKPLTGGRVSVNHPRQVLALQQQVRDAVLRNSDPAALSEDELTMAVFSAEVEVSSVFTGKERREHRQAFEALAARYDGLVPGLRKALRDSYLSSRAVGGGWGK